MYISAERSLEWYDNKNANDYRLIPLEKGRQRLRNHSRDYGLVDAVSHTCGYLLEKEIWIKIGSDNGINQPNIREGSMKEHLETSKPLIGTV